jgi:hypothetical protein
MMKGRFKAAVHEKLPKSGLSSFGWPYSLGELRSPNLRSADNFNTKAILAVF